MKGILAALIGRLSGSLIYALVAMLTVDISIALTPRVPVFFAIFFIGGWIASTVLLLRGSPTLGRVLSRGFLLGAAEWFAMAAVGFMFGRRAGESVASFSAGASIGMAFICLFGFAIADFMNRET